MLSSPKKFLAGYLAGWLCRVLLVATARSTVIPATASTIVTVGGAGVASAIVGQWGRSCVRGRGTVGTSAIAISDRSHFPASPTPPAFCDACLHP
jgi:hypothetical protein